MIPVYKTGADLPDLAVRWPDEDGRTPVDFSSGYTFACHIGADDAAVVTKTSGITGADEYPNLVVVWVAGELDPLEPGLYDVTLVAHHIALNKDRVNTGRMRIESSLVAP